MRRFILLLFILKISSSFAQKLSVSGHIQDTVAKTPLQNAVVMAVKLMDSTLVNFTRTNEQGIFNLEQLPIDTYQVIISHPKFADMGYFIFGDTKNLVYDFGKIIMQPKNVTLDEVTVFAFKDPIYYKGDTLVYVADSFKTKANATVEDLLKKLPGLKVDKDGKITSQGKSVDKVLVDGDEFFGTDPTMATRNLAANSIESVQVYEKKSDDAANASTGEETQKILNLKLKDEAKKGYFGKLSGASDFQKYHEGEVLANYFKKKLKISVFGLASNTPNSSFNWDDVYKYGLNNEFDTQYGDDGEMMMMYRTNTPQGIPLNIKSGFYYSDKIAKNTKLNINYSYNTSQVKSFTEQTSQFFLPDTSYRTSNQTNAFQKNESHTINLGLEQKIDSLTDLYFRSKINVLNGQSNSADETDFVRNDNIKTRNTFINNASNSEGFDISNNLKLIRRFKKTDRILNFNYSNAISENKGNSMLQTNNSFYNDTNSYSLQSIDQKKRSLTDNINHIASASFIEPLTKKIKLELSYDYMYYNSKQDKKSLNNVGGEYTQIDSSLTNNFINTKQINRGGLKFIYEIKKLRFTIGTKARNVFVHNSNLFTNQLITQNFNNILPFSTLRYKFSDNMALDIRYTTNSQNPTISQLQPVKDNTDPNFINIGNPNLLPTYSHGVNLNFNSWKSISGKYTWLGVSYNYINNDIVTSTLYDSIGRTLSQAININGNYNANAYVGTSIPFFSKQFEVGIDGSANYSDRKTLINNLLNKTQNFNSNLNLNLRLNIEKMEASVGGYYNYNFSQSSLNNSSNKPYTSQGLSAYLLIKLPLKFTLETDGNYTINSQRSQGYNLNYFIWDANISKTFFKKENLIIGFYAYDMLNQNISLNRNTTSNVITDTKTNIISRYYLLKATFKFNSNKAKEEEDEF